MSNIRAMDDVETRVVLTLRTGTKICVLIGLAFIVLCVYFLFVPVTDVRTSAGGVFGCGTALSPAGGSFAHGVCGDVTDMNRYRAFAALAVGVITIIAGGAMFGVNRREEQRKIARDHHEIREADVDHGRLDRDWAGGGYRRYDDGDDERSSRRRETDDRRDEHSGRHPSAPGDR